MSKATYVFIISLLLFTGIRLGAQDTIMVPLHIRIGGDVAGPAGYLLNKDLKTFAVNGGFEFNEHISFTGGTRFTHYSVKKTTYDYNSKGLTFTLGPEFNLLKPKISEGRYFIGFGILYGVSIYSHETPRLEYTNAWGTTTLSLPSTTHMGHFIELTPGVRTEIFPGVTLGWNMSLRMLLSDGTNSSLKPAYMPGFGDCSSRVSSGFSYYISISIPYRTKRIITKARAEEDDEDQVPVQEENTDNTNVLNPSVF